jgi:predicted transcriptional regulator
MPKKDALSDDMKEAVRASGREFAEMMTTPMSTARNRYLRELVAVTRAAAIGGDYVPAVKGYELLGKVLGHVVEKTEVQHTINHLSEATDAQLVEILRQPLLRAPAAPPAAVPAAPEPTEQEAEALLYA